MKYRTVPGIILTSVCDNYYLVSQKNTVVINETAAFYWKQIEKGADEKELPDLAMRYYEIDDSEELYKDIEKMLNSFLEMQMIKRLDE